MSLETKAIMKNALLSHSDKKKEKEEVKPKKKPTQPKTTTPRISRVMNSAYQSPARERSTKATKAPSRNGERARSQTSKYPRSQVVSRKQSTSALSKKRTKKNEETINITPSFKKHSSSSSDEKETQPFRGITDEERNKAKTICLGIMYGMGSHSAGLKMNMDSTEAAKITSKFFERFQRLREWIRVTKV